MKKTALLIAIITSMTLSIFASEVKIQIENGTKQDLTVYMGIVNGADAIPRNYRPIFQLSATGENAKRSYQNANITKGSTLFIYAVLSKGGKTKAQEFVIDKKKFDDSMLILVTQEDVNSEQSIGDILARYKDFSKNKSPYHESINVGKDEAFKSLFGSLVITDKDSNILMRINATSLKSNRSDYTLSGESFTVRKDFKKDAISKLNGNIPLAADLSIMFGDSDISSFNWDVRNATTLPWSLSSSETIVTLFHKNIDTLTKRYLGDLYLLDSTIKMYFIDKAYVLEGYSLKSSSFKKLTSEAEINATVYGAASSNYVRSEESSTSVSKNNIVTDVWGSDLSALLRQNSKNTAINIKANVMNAKNPNTIKNDYLLMQKIDGTLPDEGSEKFKNIKSKLINKLNNIISEFK